MIACLDVYYRDVGACAAGVVFHDWSDANAFDEKTVHIADVQSYEPGQFYRRELPCLLAVLRVLPPIHSVIIDGYVWLGSKAKPGLGAHLYEALNREVAVIGVAKTKFRGADQAREISRGSSKRPLFVTTVGIDPDLAAELIGTMHGDFRIPSLLARVDYLCRLGPIT